MSARSRALNDLADHFEKLRDEHERDFTPDSPPVYNGVEHFKQSADLARRTALEERWRERLRWERVARRLRKTLRRS